MSEQGQDHQPAIADPVGDESADEDDDAEPRQATAGDLAELRHREAILLSPLAKDAAADRKADARGKDREKAGS